MSIIISRFCDAAVLRFSKNGSMIKLTYEGGNPATVKKVWATFCFAQHFAI